MRGCKGVCVMNACMHRLHAGQLAGACVRVCVSGKYAGLMVIRAYHQVGALEGV